MRKTRGGWSSLVILVAVFAAFFGYKTVQEQTKGWGRQITTAATLLEVRPYSRSRKPRLWVKYEFVTKTGKVVRGTKAINVAKWDALQAGDRVTVKYNSKRPRRNKITAFTAPAQNQFATKPAPAQSKGGWIGGLLLGAMVLLAGYMVIARVMGPLVRLLTSLFPEPAANMEAAKGKLQSAGPWHRKRARLEGRKRDGTGSKPRRQRTQSRASRKGPGRTKSDRWGRAPTKSKVKVRAGWF